MDTQRLLGISLPQGTISDILEKIQKNIQNPADFFHIASLNPEIFVLSQRDKDFKEYLMWAQMRIVDGYGVVVAAQLRGYTLGERITGADLMEKLLFFADTLGLRVALVGGKGNLAQRVIDCQESRFPSVVFQAIPGISDISHPNKNEDDAVLSIVADFKPHIVFVAYGSPFQERWLYRHRERLKGTTCMGVGGAFDFLAGTVQRAPKFVRKLGLEWLFRLIRQPWRIKRQLRIIIFLFLVAREAFGFNHASE